MRERDKMGWEKAFLAFAAKKYLTFQSWKNLQEW